MVHRRWRDSTHVSLYFIKNIINPPQRISLAADGDGQQWKMAEDIVAFTYHARTIALNVTPTIQRVGSSPMRVEDEDPLAVHRKIYQRTWIQSVQHRQVRVGRWTFHIVSSKPRTSSTASSITGRGYRETGHAKYLFAPHSSFLSRALPFYILGKV